MVTPDIGKRQFEEEFCLRGEQQSYTYLGMHFFQHLIKFIKWRKKGRISSVRPQEISGRSSGVSGFSE